MTITANYQEDGSIFVVRQYQAEDEDGNPVLRTGRKTIPDDMANRDRRRLTEWEANGGVIAPYVPPPEPTQAELDAEQTAKIEEKGTILYALGKRIFKIERRLAALEGTDPITVAKFREEIEADLY